jgi:putative transposase
MTADFFVQALEVATAKYRVPQIFNTDQGSQFTASSSIQVLQSRIQISMDGHDVWRVHVFAEQLWKSMQYEEIYRHAYDSVVAANEGIGKYSSFSMTDAPTRHLTAIHRKTSTLNLRPSRWPHNRWSSTYPDCESCLRKRDHACFDRT